MDALVLSALPAGTGPAEIVERKGLGHPDTICDALAEAFSRNLSRHYRDRYGAILHHNVDKALLRGGSAKARFGGGEVLEPIDIYLCGRAVTRIGNDDVPIEEIAVEGSRQWLAGNMHALDPERHVRIHNLVRPGSVDLVEVFERQRQAKVPFSNDTSFGVGYAPLSPVEELVRAAGASLAGEAGGGLPPARGEDVKIMAFRRDQRLEMTVACAMIGPQLGDMDSYLAEKRAAENNVRALAAAHGFVEARIAVNTADDVAAGSVYLTVTGTSAEAGDDGQVGRGNRMNGLITPHRPMSLEAAAGKNPVTHVGKLYNALAGIIAEALCAELDQVAAAQCMLVSRIGHPITDPALVEIRIATADGTPVEDLRSRVEEIASARIANVTELAEDFLEGRRAVA